MNYANEYVKIIAVLFVLLTTLVFGMTGLAAAQSDYDLQINAVDTNGESVNASYQVLVLSDATTIANGQTGSDGVVNVSGLSDGTEYLVEVGGGQELGPAGKYSLSSKTINYTGSQIVEELTVDSDLAITVEDSNGNPVQTDYTLYDETNNFTIVSSQTGSDGVGTAAGLTQGNDLNLTIAQDDINYQTYNEVFTYSGESTKTATLSEPTTTYNLEIGVLFDDNLQSNINYVIEDNQGNQVASGQTVSDGPSTESLPEGDYTVSVATQTPEFAEESRSVSLTAQTTESFDLQLEQYNLTINTGNSQGDSIDTDYEVLDSDNNTVATGQTGADGQVVETLPYDTYTVNVAENDSEYKSGSTTHELTSDYTMTFQRDLITYYDLTINAEDSSGDPVNTTYSVEDSEGTEVASGETGSDGQVVESLAAGDYKVSIGIDDPAYQGQSTTYFTLDSAQTQTLSTSESTYDLTVETEDSDANAVDTNYTIVDSSGSQVASGNTGTDGLATHTLAYDDYDVTVASSDARYAEDTQTVTLDSTQTQSFTLSAETYGLTIQTEDSDGNAINTTYSVLDNTGTEVASGQTGSDGSVVESLEYGDYDVETSVDDPTYDQKSRSVTLDGATTQTFDATKSSYTITIGASDEFEDIETDYEVKDSDSNVVASGTTDPDNTVTETLSAGDYTVEYGTGDREVYSQSESIVVDSDQTVSPTLDRIDLSVTVDSGTIYEGVETTFDADVSNHPDSDYTYDWYVNNESVATGSDDTLNYMFNDSGEFQIRVETTIDGNEYVATRPIPDGVWTDTNVEDGDDPQSTEGEKKVEFGKIEISTVDANGSVVATHIVNANLRENLTGDQINEDRIRVAKKGEVTTWQVIATHDAYIRAEHPDYKNRFATVDFDTLQTSSLVGVQIGFGEGQDANVTSSEDAVLNARQRRD